MLKKCFIGIDVGGTKISAALVTDKGGILAREKCPTPKNGGHRKILNTLSLLMEDLLQQKNLKRKNILGIGIGIPGIVNPENGRILITPNANLSGFALGKELRKKMKTRVVIGNDVNLGILGEQWLGAGKGKNNILGIFPGTGIGGGIILNGKLLLGAQGAAAEIGHMTIDLKGPLCHCGNRGCLEAYCGRWAIERDIRSAIHRGRKSIITKLIKGNLKTIKSGTLKEALKKKDNLVTHIMKEKSEILGLGCVSLRHAFDPEIIVLGGGLIEACGNFILPIVKRMIKKDPFFSRLGPCAVVPSKLEDNAVILGAVAAVKNA